MQKNRERVMDTDNQPVVYTREQGLYGSYRQQLDVRGNRSNPDELFIRYWREYLTLPARPVQALNNAICWISGTAIYTMLSATLPSYLQCTLGVVAMFLLILPWLALQGEPSLLPLILLRMVLVTLGLIIGVAIVLI